MDLLPKVPEVLSRRQVLLTAMSAVLLARARLASSESGKKIDWPVFNARMAKLADAKVDNEIDQQTVVNFGMQYLKQLDIHSPAFKQAVDESYETGNRYWLWQRMIKANNLNGGILHIERGQIVQLHDHPGATGMVRIISGEAEVWLFDEVRINEAGIGQGEAELVRVSRRTLRPGDTAILTPDKGNIHALRSVSDQCRMLDFFIPPYQRSQRSWFEPLSENWFDRETIRCRKIPQHKYLLA